MGCWNCSGQVHQHFKASLPRFRVSVQPVTGQRRRTTPTHPPPSHCREGRRAFGCRHQSAAADAGTTTPQADSRPGQGPPLSPAPVLTPQSSSSVTTRPGCEGEARGEPLAAEPAPTAAPAAVCPCPPPAPRPPPPLPSSRCRGGRCRPARSGGCSRG